MSSCLPRIKKLSPLGPLHRILSKNTSYLGPLLGCDGENRKQSGWINDWVLVLLPYRVTLSEYLPLTHMHTHSRTHTHMYTHTYAHTHFYTNVYICSYVHMYPTHLHIHTYTHTRHFKSSWEKKELSVSVVRYSPHHSVHIMYIFHKPFEDSFSDHTSQHHLIPWNSPIRVLTRPDPA